MKVLRGLPDEIDGIFGPAIGMGHGILMKRNLKLNVFTGDINAALTCMPGEQVTIRLASP